MGSIDSQRPCQRGTRGAAANVLTIAAFLGACAESPPASPAPVVGHEVECSVEPALALVGRPDTPDNRRELLRLSGATTLRVLRPGDGATSDYQTARVNLLLDGHGRIGGVTCG